MMEVVHVGEGLFVGYEEDPYQSGLGYSKQYDRNDQGADAARENNLADKVAHYDWLPLIVK